MDPRGFITSLFDLSFSDFITTKIVKFLYILGIIIAAIVSLTAIVSGFGLGAGRGIITLILSPVIFLLMVIFYRIWLEMIIVIFRIAEHTSEIAKK